MNHMDHASNHNEEYPITRTYTRTYILGFLFDNYFRRTEEVQATSYEDAKASLMTTYGKAATDIYLADVL